MKFQNSSIHGFKVMLCIKKRDERTDGRTDGRTDEQLRSNMPLQLHKKTPEEDYLMMLMSYASSDFLYKSIQKMYVFGTYLNSLTCQGSCLLVEQFK